MKKTTFILLNSAALLAGTTLAQAATLVADYQFDGNLDNSVAGSDIGSLQLDTTTIDPSDSRVKPGKFSYVDGKLQVDATYYTMFDGLDSKSMGENWAISFDWKMSKHTVSSEETYYQNLLGLSSKLSFSAKYNKNGPMEIGFGNIYNGQTGGTRWFTSAYSYDSNLVLNIAVVSAEGKITLLIDGTDVTSTLSSGNFSCDSFDLDLADLTLGGNKNMMVSYGTAFGAHKGTQFDNLQIYSGDFSDTLDSFKSAMGLVPEPSAFGLLAGAGVLALAAARRRRPCRKS